MLFRLRALLFLVVTVLLLPVLLAVWLTIAFFNLICSLAGTSQQDGPSNIPPKSDIASIIVLNWNGKDLLAQGIPSILEAVRRDGRPHEVMVVDNGSTDDSVQYIEANYPQIRVLALKENIGFAEGNNAGAQAAKNDIIVLLNNDMVVDPGFLGPLLAGFGPKTFAVSSQIFLQDTAKRREETGKTTAEFRRGMVDYAHLPIETENHRPLYPVFWAGGGSSAFHREKFLALGGFHDIYSPAYVEDTDISYQAWRLGWEVLLAPESIVYHKHRTSTARRFNKSQLQALVLRNQYLFIWKNIHSWPLLLSHGFFLPWNCYRLARDHGMAAWRGLFQAVRKIPSVESQRLQGRLRSERTDRQVFNLFKRPALFFRGRQRSKSEGKPRVLWVTAYLPHTGRHAGAGRMLQLLKRMATRYRITLATFLETDEEIHFLPEAEPYCEEIIAMRRSHPPRWQIFPYEPFDEFLTPEMLQAVDRFLEERDFELVHLEYTQMGVYADRASGIPVLLTKHEVDFAACARRARTESNPVLKMRWFYNYLQVLDREIHLTKKVNAVICMTDPDARELKKFAPYTPVHVISTGVDLEYFSPPARLSDDPRLIFVGAFQHLPNVEAMLFFCKDVLPVIRKEVPGIEMLIVGSNPPASIAALASIPGVQVTGFVPDIRPYMADSAVYVVPLRLGVGIRGKILEAWGMGMAVVTTSVGCAGLQFEHERNLMVADTPEQLAKSVIALLRDPARRRRLGKEGRKTVEEFYSWDSSAQKLDTLYQHMIASSQPVQASGQSKQGSGRIE